MKFIYLLLVSLFCLNIIGCVVEEPTYPVYPTTVWVGGYWAWDGRVHVWVPGRWEHRNVYRVRVYHRR